MKNEDNDISMGKKVTSDALEELSDNDFPSGTVVDEIPTTEFPSGTVVDEIPTTEFPFGTIANGPSSDTEVEEVSSSNTIENQKESLEDLLSFSNKKQEETDSPQEVSEQSNLPELLVPELQTEDKVKTDEPRKRKKGIDKTILISGIVIVVCLAIIVGVVLFISFKNKKQEPVPNAVPTKEFVYNEYKYIIAEDIQYSFKENSPSIVFRNSQNTIAGSFAIGKGNYDENILGDINGYQQYIEKDGYVVQSHEVIAVDGVQYVLYHCIYREKPMIAFIAKVTNNYIAAGILFSTTGNFDQGLKIASDFFSDVTVPQMRMSELQPDFSINQVFRDFYQTARA